MGPQLDRRVDANGYLLLHTAAPLSVDNDFDGGFGFGTTPGNTLELASHLYCGQPESDTSTRRRQANGDGSHFVAWCSDGGLHLVAEGSSTFLDQAATALQPVRSRQRRDATTTSSPGE